MKLMEMGLQSPDFFSGLFENRWTARLKFFGHRPQLFTNLELVWQCSICDFVSVYSLLAVDS